MLVCAWVQRCLFCKRLLDYPIVTHVHTNYEHVQINDECIHTNYERVPSEPVAAGFVSSCRTVVNAMVVISSRHCACIHRKQSVLSAMQTQNTKNDMCYIMRVPVFACACVLREYWQK